ncbi:MAG: hypothetical protein JO168_04515 [Solirubrobacterales bacterium]|nr:hypothetical protein [Solirubrobacterales bacterium]
MSQESSAPRDQVASQVLQLDPSVIDELADRLGDVVVQRVVDAIRAERLAAEAIDPQAWLDANDVAE